MKKFTTLGTIEKTLFIPSSLKEDIRYSKIAVEVLEVKQPVRGQWNNPEINKAEVQVTPPELES